ncbi:MAG TPA: hypothetical protein V6D19_23730 [Stenomitos sp.]
MTPQWGWIPSREDQIQSIMSGATQGEMTNPMQGRINVMSALLEAQAESGKRLQAAMNADPKLRELAKGRWEYFESDKSAKSAYGCAAAYIDLKGALLLSEAGNGYQEAILTFIGVGIPRPIDQKTIQVTLDQEDGRPQSVKVLNFAVPGSSKLGALSFEIPSMKLLLDNMEDKQGFDVLIEKQSVINIAWNGGKEAREQLLRCISAKR